MSMNIKQQLKLTPNNLAREQFYALKDHAVDVLDKVKTLIINEEFDKIDALTKFSPSGDGYGLDNTFIDFCFTDNKDGDDIQSVVNKLIELKEQSKEQSVDS